MACLLLAGCRNQYVEQEEQKEPEEHQDPEKPEYPVVVPEQEKLYEIFTASIPDLDSDDNRSPFSIPATRAHLVDGQKMLWDELDSLGIFSDKQGIGAYGYSDGAFHGEPIEGNKFHAFYPYRKDALPDSENPNLLHTRLPYNDRYKEGTFSRHLPMVAVSENNELHFKHTCGILRFSIKSSLYVKLVNLLANDRSEMLIGNGVIDLSEEITQIVIKYNIIGYYSIISPAKFRVTTT